MTAALVSVARRTVVACGGSPVRVIDDVSGTGRSVPQREEEEERAKEAAPGHRVTPNYGL
jgi:hypothetical protein